MYFSARFTDIDLKEDIQNENTSKLIIKGARLKFYKTGQKIFTTSRGIVRNKGQTVTQEELEEITKGAKLVYADSKIITKINENGKEYILNKTTYQQYNKNLKEELHENISKHMVIGSISDNRSPCFLAGTEFPVSGRGSFE